MAVDPASDYSQEMYRPVITRLKPSTGLEVTANQFCFHCLLSHESKSGFDSCKQNNFPFRFDWAQIKSAQRSTSTVVQSWIGLEYMEYMIIDYRWERNQARHWALERVARRWQTATGRYASG